MEPTRDAIDELRLIPWEGQHQGLALSWRSGWREAYPIGGEPEHLREKVTVSAEDGARLRRVLQQAHARDGWSYSVHAGPRFVVELPGIVFEWSGEPAPPIEDPRAEEPTLA